MGAAKRPDGVVVSDLVQRVTDLRAGGAVERCHAIRHVGSYSVAAHTHGVLTLLYALWPSEPPARLVRAVHYHDVHEAFTGDVPVTVSWLPGSRFDEELGKIESAVRHGLGIGRILSDLSEEEVYWLYALDKLELWLWCCEQKRLGNDHVDPVIERLEGWLESRGDEIPEPVRKFWDEWENRRPSFLDEVVR
jgi:5'-deoxynucleotidase YfbR-like HD superfamily hydrolase